jgi:hypothetical protein
MIKVDTREFEALIKRITPTAASMRRAAGAGAAVQIAGQRQRVAVDTGDTRDGIGSHITEQSATKVVDEIGPETPYAPNIEMGVQSKPNYPIQPFVRPTANEDGNKTLRAIQIDIANTIKG